MVNKVNRNIDFLTDDFGNLVGYQKSPGVEVGLVTAKANDLSTMIKKPAQRGLFHFCHILQFDLDDVPSMAF